MSIATYARAARPVALIALAIAAVVGCGHPARRAEGSSTATASGSASASPLAASWPCLAGAGGRRATVPGDPPRPIALFGHARHVVVMSNQSDEDLCSWLPLMRTLTRRGFQVVLYDYVSAPQSDLRSIVRYLRGHGAATVALLGASEGAKTSIIVGAGLRDVPSAVVSLSAEALLQGQPVRPSAHKLTCPTLYVTAANDPYGSTAATRKFHAVAPAHTKRLVVVRGDAHGTALLKTRSVRSAVISFLTAHGR